MTYVTLKRTSLAALVALTLSVSLPAASAMANEAPSGNFNVTSTTNGLIKLGVKAFKRGDYKRAIKLTEQATRAPISKKKLSIAYSNLCASYAKVDMIDLAQKACVTALDLRPAYEPAQANKAALTIRLAQTKP